MPLDHNEDFDGGSGLTEMGRDERQSRRNNCEIQIAERVGWQQA